MFTEEQAAEAAAGAEYSENVSTDPPWETPPMETAVLVDRSHETRQRGGKRKAKEALIQ